MNSNQVQEEVTQQATIQSINLIEGLFTPSEASDILLDIIDKKINFHKLQMLKIFEGNHDDPCNYDHGRLDELKMEKERLKEIIRDVRQAGKKMKIKSEINIVAID
jgi:hypothetical protein